MDWGAGENGELLLNGLQSHCGDTKNFVSSGDGCTTWEMELVLPNCTFQNS